MAPTYSAPGVYIDEISNRPAPIEPVKTSTAAFIGRSRRGPINRPIRVHSFAEFTAFFGDPWQPATLPYSVKMFFLNGGQEAIIVRVFNGNLLECTATLQVETEHSALILEAKNPGTWGSNLSATVTNSPSSSSDLMTFDLLVEVLNPQTDRPIISERFENLSTRRSHERYAVAVLAEQSTLVNIRSGLEEGAIPLAATYRVRNSVGHDGTNITDAEIIGDRHAKTGMYALESAGFFDLLNIPPPTPDTGVSNVTWASAASFCAQRRAMLIVDPPADLSADRYAATAMARTWIKSLRSLIGNKLATNVAVYFPQLQIADPTSENTVVNVAPGGAVAGVISRIDQTHGIWKAPAGVNAAINGITGMSLSIERLMLPELNHAGLNSLIRIPGRGYYVWGARTLAGNNGVFESKYISVRRLVLFIKLSLTHGIQWATFEPNNRELWSKLQFSANSFMQQLYLNGAFAGTHQNQAWFVRCDESTNTQSDIAQGVVNIMIGFAPLKPAEFVILKIQQRTGETDS